MKKIILWELVTRERSQSFLALFEKEFPKSKFEFHLDEDSTSFNEVSKHIVDDTCILIHLGNFWNDRIPDILSIVTLLNEQYPSLYIVLYSGGMEKSLEDNEGNFQFWVNGKGEENHYHLTDLAHPDKICVLPQKVRDDLVTDINLEKGMEVYEKKGDIQEFFKVIKGEKESLNILLDLLRFFEPLQKIQEKENDQIALLELEKLKKRGDLKEQEYTQLASMIKEARSGFGGDEDKEHMFYGNLRNIVDVIVPALI
ncbi:MAG: hypothetical protein DWQ02_20915 [Bacteroidetes bacterium]|nr:MAG: hypothetical protein DWQ02_20915 [Bacteroidota bacterium]